MTPLRRALKGAWLFLVVGALFPAPRPWLKPAQAAPRYATVVRLTYYLDATQPMADGEWPYVGAAACSYDLSLGTRITFADGWSVVCHDRGDLGDGTAYTWVDAFGADWLPSVWGDWATVEIE